jgi:hypothetical protein
MICFRKDHLYQVKSKGILWRRTKVAIASLVAILLLMGCGSKSNNSKEKVSMINELEKIVSRLHISDTKEIDSLSGIIDEQAYQDIKTLVRLKKDSTEKERSQVSAFLLMNAGELSIAPLLDSLNMQNPSSLISDMQIVTNAHSQAASRIAAMLEKMLLDKREVPRISRQEKLEETPPVHRICDDAYLMLKRLFHYSAEDIKFTEERAFLNWEFDRRDREILRFMGTKAWKSFSESGEGN